MAKIVRFSDGARGALRRGVDQMANAVTVTLGPSGRSVVLHPLGTEPVLTQDGLTIASQIELPDPHENLGAQLLREVAAKTVEATGDGTTTSVLLTQSVVCNGLLEVDRGTDPHELKRGMDLALEAVLEELKRASRPLSTQEDLAQAAMRAGLGEADAALVASALRRAGSTGVVELEVGTSGETELCWALGHQMESGYLSPYFINQPETMEVVLDRPYILFYEQKLSDLEDLIPVLEKVVEENASLLIIAEDVDSEALATLVMNRLRGTLQIAAAKAPGFGDRRREHLKDLAVMTGGTLFGSGSRVDLAAAELAHLGRAEQVLMTKESTTFLGGAGVLADIEKRAKALTAQIESTESEYVREKLILRRARLRGEIAILTVGDESEVGVMSKRDRFADALAATRLAMSEGIVPGGGVAYLRAGAALDSLKGRCAGEEVGIEVIRTALSTPAHKIAENAGYDGNAVVQSILLFDDDRGLNAETGKEEPFFQTGIVDPARVVRIALQNAVSMGSLILTTESLVAEESGDGDERAAS